MRDSLRAWYMHILIIGTNNVLYINSDSICIGLFMSYLIVAYRIRREDWKNDVIAEAKERSRIRQAVR